MSISQEEAWLLKEKYGGEKTALVFKESLDEIKNKYSWGEDFFTDLERLKAGEPLAYIIGHTPFLNCQINLNSHPLIPRVETEYWVEKAIESIRRENISNVRVLDLCAGSGCVGVAVAKAVRDARVNFSRKI